MIFGSPGGVSPATLLSCCRAKAASRGCTGEHGELLSPITRAPASAVCDEYELGCSFSARPGTLWTLRASAFELMRAIILDKGSAWGETESSSGLCLSALPARQNPREQPDGVARLVSLGGFVKVPARLNLCRSSSTTTIEITTPPMTRATIVNVVLFES